MLKGIISIIVSTYFVLISSILYADNNIIEKIDVNGVQRIDIETVISYSEAEIGEVYDEELGNNILKKLFETNLFSNIEISFNNNSLTILVKENPTINLVSFVGNKKIDDEDLLIEISLKERSVYSRSKVKKDIERMLTLYQRSGRLSTEINPTVEVIENNRINLTYEIKESEITEVSKIIVIGNKKFSSRKIKSLMKTKEKTFLRLLSSADKYDPDKLEYDKQLITQFYNNNGYADFKFISSIAQLTPNSNNFEIVLTINEGEIYNFGNIKITSELMRLNTDYIADVIPYQSGDVYNFSKVKDSVETIKDIAEVNGYSFVDITPEIKNNEKNRTIDVEVIINEGPRVYVNNIDIKGNKRTIDKVIRREMSLSEGDAYNKYSINYSKDSIRALNFFSDVNIDEVRTEFPDKIDLDITVEEKSTGEASVGAGYSSSTSASVQLGLKENNFLGRGQKVVFSGAFSSTRTTYDIAITEPYFNDKELSLTGQLYSNFYDPASVNYETDEIGFGFSSRFPIASDKSLELRYSLFTSKIKADKDATAYENLLAGTDTVSLIGQSFSFDRRNSRYKPSEGFNLKINQDLAGLGGTSYYFKNSLEYNVYQRITSNFIGAFKLRAGNINGYNGKYGPVSSNFNLGGKNLRGFKAGKVGPKTGDSYTGGQYYYLTSFETNIDLNLDAFDITSTLFLDAGSVWGLDNPAYGSIDDSNEMRSSIGLNLNWDSAIGPINIVYAHILQSEDTDTTDSLYFDIGYNF